MKVFYFVLIASNMVHIVLLIVLNKRRIIKLRDFIVNFKERGMLSDKDYQLLDGRYNGIFSYLEFFPDKVDFANLYEDEPFARFVAKTKKRLKILAIGAAISMTLTFIFVPMGKEIRIGCTSTGQFPTACIE